MTALTHKKISAATVDEADQLLDTVVDELRQLAGQDGVHGILVTKTGPGQFTVELSEQVPFGVTEEAIA